MSGHAYLCATYVAIYRQGLHEKFFQDGTRLLWGPGDRLRLLSKLRIFLGPIIPLLAKLSTRI